MQLTPTRLPLLQTVLVQQLVLVRLVVALPRDPPVMIPLTDEVVSAVVVLVQLVFTYVEPVQILFDTRPIDATAWLVIGLFGVGVFLAVEAEKALTRKLIRR